MTFLPQTHAETRQSILSTISENTSVSLVGLRGSGRSAVLRDVIRHLERTGHRVVALAGIRSLSERALEALYLTGIPSHRLAGSGLSISGAVDDLCESLSGPKPVMVIDDFDELDDASIGAISAAHHRLGFPILLTTLPGGHARDSAKAHTFSPQRVVRMSPLRYDEIYALISDRLNGNPETDVVSRINAKSGGLPGIALAITNTAQREKNLVRRDNVWAAHRSLWSDSLISTVQPFLDDLSPKDVDALNKLALVGGVDAPAAVRLIGWESLQKLDEAQLLVFLPTDGGLRAAIYPPLIAEYFRRAPIGVRRLRIHTEIAAALGGKTELLNYSEGEVEGAEGPRSFAPVRESDAAFNLVLNERWNSRLRADRAEWEKSPTWETAAPYLGTLLTKGASSPTVEDVLANTRPVGDADSRVEYALWEARYRAIQAHDVHAALQRLSDLEPELEDAGAARARLERITLEETLIEVTPKLENRITAIADAPVEEQENFRISCARTAVFSARPVLALSLLEGLPTDPAGAGRERDAVHAVALVSSGRVMEALEFSRSRLRESLSLLELRDVHCHAWVVSFALSLQGRIPELQDHLSSVLSIGIIPLESTAFHTGNLSVSAIIAARQGRHEAAESFLQDAERTESARGFYPYLEPAWARAIIQSVSGEEGEGSDALWTVAQSLMTRGYYLSAIFAAICSLEISPRISRLPELQYWAKGNDSPLFEMLMRYVDALARNNADTLFTIAEELAQAALTRYAIRAYLAASRGYRSGGKTTEEDRAKSLATGLLESSGGEFDAWIDHPEVGVPLTSREKEVTQLVVEGLTNHEIARILVLSVRTVESHLHRIFRKIGAENRQELIALAKPAL